MCWGCVSFAKKKTTLGNFTTIGACRVDEPSLDTMVPSGLTSKAELATFPCWARSWRSPKFLKKWRPCWNSIPLKNLRKLDVLFNFKTLLGRPQIHATRMYQPKPMTILDWKKVRMPTTGATNAMPKKIFKFSRSATPDMRKDQAREHVGKVVAKLRDQSCPQF